MKGLAFLAAAAVRLAFGAFVGFGGLLTMVEMTG